MNLKELPELPSKFRPDEYITVPEQMIKEEISPLGNTVSGTFPCRIHITPIDCNRFAYGRPGGGGIGFGVLSTNELKLALSNSFGYEGPQLYRPIVHRALAVAKKAFNLNNTLNVVLNLSPEVSPHSGLGSNAIIMSGILFAVNALFKRPFTDEEIRFLVAANFAENDDGISCPGLETGLASAIMAYGGFNLVGDRIHHIWQNPALYMPDIHLAKLDISRKKFSGSEDDAMLVRSLREDLDNRGIRSYEILMDLIPAIADGDLKAIGDAVWRIQFGGTHLSMIQAYGRHGSEMYEFICNARSAGIEIVGMSSVGPTFFLVSDRAETVKSYLEHRGITYYVRKAQSEPIYCQLEVK